MERPFFQSVCSQVSGVAKRGDIEKGGYRCKQLDISDVLSTWLKILIAFVAFTASIGNTNDFTIRYYSPTSCGVYEFA